jgi:2-iminoacetate synthase
MLAQNEVDLGISIDHLVTCLETDDEMFKTYYEKAIDITAQEFGNKRTLFNPIYISNKCVNDCPYCGYRKSNKKIGRKTLKPKETVKEALFLTQRGVKCILLVAGDYKHSKYVEMLCQNIKDIKKHINPEWLGVGVAVLEIDEYKMLKEAGATFVSVFQETYNRSLYQNLHEDSVYKADFNFRYHAQERAIEAGFNEVGLGVLYGVGFWKEDTYNMAEHAIRLREKYPHVKLRFSFPRLQKSENQSETCKREHISSSQLLRAITGIRLMFPDSSLVLTGRETVDFLCQQSAVVNVLGYGGRTNVGGYTINVNGISQFELNRQNTFESFVTLLKEKKYVL